MTGPKPAPITIPAAERHRLRLFSLDVPPSDLDRLTRPEGALPDGAALSARAELLAALMGVGAIDGDFVEVFDAADLADLGLEGYLAEGGNIPADQIDPDRARLAKMHGPVLVLFSRALQGAAATLYPDPRLTLIGTYVEDVPPIHFEPLPSAAAKGTLTPPLSPAGPARLPPAVLVLGAALLITGLVAVFLALR